MTPCYIAVSFSKAVLLGTIGHLLISLLLGIGVFAFGMAAGGGRAQHNEPTAHVSLSAFNIWNAGFAYVWRPIKSRILPDRKALPSRKIGDEAALVEHRLQERWTWIDRIRDWSDPIVFLSWAVLCGYGFAGVREQNTLTE